MLDEFYRVFPQCPFCGSIKRYEYPLPNFDNVTIECQNCGAKIRIEEIDNKQKEVKEFTLINASTKNIQEEKINEFKKLIGFRKSTTFWNELNRFELNTANITSKLTEFSKQTKFCSNCGVQIDTKAEICPKCGVRIALPAHMTTISQKNPTTAAFLSFFIVGTGQMYVGRFLRGIGFLLGAILCAFIFSDFGLILVFLVGILSVSDAYDLAKKYNEEYQKNGKPPW